MTVWLDEACGWLSDVQREFAAVGVIYCRGSDEYETQGVFGGSDYQEVDAEGFIVEAHVVDVVVAVEDWPQALGEPMPGDRVVVEGEIVYEVSEIPGEGCWRWTDPSRTAMRIHLQET